METAGHYRILERVGSGGMGVVFKAEDTRLRRTVALKFLPASMTGDDRAVARLGREARTASSLNHPNICTIYDIGEAEGRPFIAMEFLDGQPLNVAIASGPLETARLVDFGIQIADALDAAHAHGIVHRDVKPANIFITRRGHVKVLDFGIARPGPEPAGTQTTVLLDDDNLMVTQPGTVAGTLAYMSPEQALSKSVDARSDVFSLGLVLFEMATGRQAFDGDTPAAVYDAVLNRQPPPARELNGALPPGFEEIVSRALEKDPDLRYQTAADLRADLQRLKRNIDTGRHSASALASGAVTARTSMPPSSTAPSAVTASSLDVARRRPANVWIAAAGVVVVIGAGAALFLNSQRSPLDAPGPVLSSAPPVAGSQKPPPPAPLPAGGGTSPAGGASLPAPPSNTPSTKGGNRATGDRAEPPPVPRPAVSAPSPPTAVPAAAERGDRPLTGRGRGPRPELSPEVKAARSKIQAGDLDGAVADLQKITQAPHDQAPLDAYGALLDAENRRGRRLDFTNTLTDMATRYPSDPRVPFFLVATARTALQNPRPARAIYALELAKKVLQAYPASPAAVDARTIVQQVESARGRGRV